ncbi:hypothetical protein IWW56_003046 [Coemansia sp. RSA 2131]|nr:hypothetical protein IWW56_003046 [Coemansia sp. RSA 2131]
MSADNSLFKNTSPDKGSSPEEAHEQKDCQNNFCVDCIESEYSESDSDSDSNYSPDSQIKLVIYQYNVSATEFLEIPYPNIPVFSGKPYEVTGAFFECIEREWAEYAHLQAHWVAKLRSSFLSGEALVVAKDFVGYDWKQFCAYMEKWFPTFNARMHMRYQMIDSHSYLVDLDLRQAIAQARQDYQAQGDEYDAPEPAGNLSKRIPQDICTKYNFVAHQHTSGRAILKALENIVWKEKVGCCSVADWLKPVSKSALPIVELPNVVSETTPKQPVVSTTNLSVIPAPALTPTPVSAATSPHSSSGSRQIARRSSAENPYYDYLSRMIQ